MQLATLHALNATRRARQAAIMITDTGSGAVRLVREIDDYSADPLAEILGERFRSGKSGTVQVEAGEVFLTVSLPPPRLVVIGAVHISQALAPMARIAGFDVTIIDPRTAFATHERFPDAALLVQWPDKAFSTVPLDAFTALAAVTHDPKIDDFALAAALEAGCFYVGALGSRKTHARRLERLEASGICPEATARIRAPIGLAIQAQSPAEIGVSILAEVISALRTRGVDAPTRAT